MSTRRLTLLAAIVIGVGVVCAGIKLVWNDAYGIDYGVYRTAASAVVHGKSLFSPWMAEHMRYPYPFTYPPFAALVALPAAALGARSGFLLWTAVSIALLALVVRAYARPVLVRFRRPALALAVLVLAACALTPVLDEFYFGQVGIALMALCVFDCKASRPRWPRGLLVGIATAVKLLPAIFIPYLWFSGRRRAAIVATVTAVGCELATAVVLPSDSHEFWFSKVFDTSRVGGNDFFSNQSVRGMLLRDHASAVWLVLTAVIGVLGLVAAVRYSRAGDELRGIVVTGLVGVLISPVSWIHHFVWIVPALLLLLGDATNRRRVLGVFTVALLFALRIPYLTESVPVVRDCYGLLTLALLLALVPRARASIDPPDAQAIDARGRPRGGRGLPASVARPSSWRARARTPGH